MVFGIGKAIKKRQAGAEAAVRSGKAKARKKGRGEVAVGLVKKGVKVAVKEARKYEFVDGEEPAKRKPAKKKIVKAAASKTKVFGGKRYTLQSLHVKKSVASNKRDALKAKGKSARVVSTVKGYSVYTRSK